MITWGLGVIVKTLFVVVVGLLRGIFGTFWTSLASRVATISNMDGVSVGLGIFDTFVGIDFIAWATGLAVTVVITVKMIRLILGLFSKA